MHARQSLVTWFCHTVQCCKRGTYVCSFSNVCPADINRFFVSGCVCTCLLSCRIYFATCKYLFLFWLYWIWEQGPELLCTLSAAHVFDPNKHIKKMWSTHSNNNHIVLTKCGPPTPTTPTNTLRKCAPPTPTTPNSH